jgi:hypothetical protein
MKYDIQLPHPQGIRNVRLLQEWGISDGGGDSRLKVGLGREDPTELLIEVGERRGCEPIGVCGSPLVDLPVARELLPKAGGVRLRERCVMKELNQDCKGYLGDSGRSHCIPEQRLCLV